MAFQLATIAMDAACDAIVDLFDVGAGANAVIRIFANTQATNPETAHGATAGEKLALLNFSATAFDSAGSAGP